MPGQITNTLPGVERIDWDLHRLLWTRFLNVNQIDKTGPENQFASLKQQGMTKNDCRKKHEKASKAGENSLSKNHRNHRFGRQRPFKLPKRQRWRIFPPKERTLNEG